MDLLGLFDKSGNDNPALTEHGRSLTYSELEQCATTAARQLWTLGARPGTRVALTSPGSADQVVITHAVIRLGAAVAPLDPRATPAELRERLAELQPSVVVRDPAEVAAAEPSEVAEVAAGHALDDVACVVHTSGTSGRPRAVELTRGNIMWSALGAAARTGISPADRWLCCMPLHHIGGLSIPLRCAMFGASVAMEPFDPEAIGRALEAQPITLASLVPTMLARLLDAGARPGRLRCVLLGGGPAPRTLVERALEAGYPIAPTYGLTEAASQVATLTPGEACSHPGSSGPPLVHARIRIAADGRIEIRGPSVAPGVAGPDGWLRTGDLGRIDPDGHLRVLGRADDVIITGGENVSPEEVEQVLLSHPGVADVAVAGRPDPEWQTAVVAYVVAGGGVEPSSEELRSFCRRRLAPHKVPKSFEPVARLPRSAQGKLLRGELPPAPE